jgi:hypothetical protein
MHPVLFLSPGILWGFASVILYAFVVPALAWQCLTPPYLVFTQLINFPARQKSIIVSALLLLWLYLVSFFLMLQDLLDFCSHVLYCSKQLRLMYNTIACNFKLNIAIVFYSGNELHRYVALAWKAVSPLLIWQERESCIIMRCGLQLYRTVERWEQVRPDRLRNAKCNIIFHVHAQHYVKLIGPSQNILMNHSHLIARCSNRKLQHIMW